MKILFKGVTIAIVIVIVATVAVFSSNSYFKSIEASDKSSTSDLTTTIVSYLDEVDYETNTRNQNAAANNDMLINGSSTTGGGSGEEAAVPEFATGLEAYIYALNKYTNAKAIIVETTGVAKTAIGDQNIKVLRQRNSSGDIYFTMATYSSFVQIAREAYYDGRIFRQRSTSTVSSSLIPTYDGNWIQSTAFTSALKTYKQKYGVGPDELNYIVTGDTIIDTTFKAEEWKAALAAEENYTFSFNLKPNEAGDKYKYNVKENAGAKNLPSFTRVSVEATINAKGNFVKLVSKDAYSLTVAGVTSDITTEVTDNFKLIGNSSFDVTVPSGL